MTGPLERVTQTLRLALDTLTSGDCRLAVLPCRTALYLGGEVPWDVCETGKGGTNGQLWANLTNLTPVAGGSDSSNCPSYNWTAELGIVRCVSSLNPDGSPPRVSDVEADAALQAQDADAIWSALACCATRPEPLQDVVLSSWAPLNGGKCAGGAWTVRGRLTLCC